MTYHSITSQGMAKIYETTDSSELKWTGITVHLGDADSDLVEKILAGLEMCDRNSNNGEKNWYGR